jgi:two-component system, sensor histidine kinase RegB
MVSRFGSYLGVDHLPHRRHYAIADPHISTAIWLTQLRWVAVIGQLTVIGIVEFLLRIHLDLLPLLILVGWTAVTNVGMWYWSRRLTRCATSPTVNRNQTLAAASRNRSFSDDTIGNRALTAVLSMDVLTLTGLLYFTGGASNPFLLFYFANIAIAGMILPKSLAWWISTMSIGGIILLLNSAISVSEIGNSPLADESAWGVAKFAFLVAFSMCCCVITYFVTMLAGELRERESQLAIAEKERERARRLEAMATLAAGAGHELASPLSTIAVVAKELSRSLDKYDVSSSVRKDVELIREELNRCREILHRMKSGAGEAAAENLNSVSLQEIVQTTIEPMREPHRVIVEMPPSLSKRMAILPKQAVAQAIRNLLQNGLDASSPHEKVVLRISEETDSIYGERMWHMEVIDRGMGLSDEVSRRIGEPFFTTKEVGQGMGLGVFLTRNVIHGVGGTITFECPTDGGTTCRITIPARSTS